MSTTPPLFARLIDDAAMFPPGNASAAEAIAEHLRYRRSWFAELIGPLLVPAAKWDDFAAAHTAAGAPALSVVLIGGHRLPARLPEPITVVGFELPVPAPPLPGNPEGTTLAVEVAAMPAGGPLIQAVAAARAGGRPVVAKFRTGGTVAEAFPDEIALAELIVAAAGAGVPLKLTAGLHHAIRHTGAGTGFEHHGFLNVLVAVSLAAAGEGVPPVGAALSERDARRVADQVRSGVSPGLRERFVSFGCCGVEDPVGDLVSLGLIEAPAAIEPPSAKEA